MRKRRRLSLDERTPKDARIPPTFFRVVALAVAGVLACAWAIHRAWTTPHQPQIVPVPAPAELPAPDIERK